MPQFKLCDPYAWEDPGKFLKEAWWKIFEGQSRKPCASEVVNQMLFIYLFASLAGISIALFLNYMMAIPISLLFATVYLYPAFNTLREIRTFGDPSASKIEGFEDRYTGPTGITSDSPDVAGPVTFPTAKNPFMNVLVNEIKYNPTKSPAAPINDPMVKGALDEVFRVQFTSDPTDVFGKTQSQREFVAMPSTTVPNDQGSFANWLYKIPGKTCKEGGREACLPGTDGGPVTWLNVNR
jgi:hypothetical protein